MGESDYIEVIISSRVLSHFAQLVYDGPLQSTVRAVGFCNNTSSTPTGFPGQPFTILGGDPSCEDESVLTSGNSNDIYGPVHSNNDWKLSGNSNNFYGEVTYAGSNTQTESGNYIESGPTDNNTAYDWPLAAFNMDDYKPGGLYSSDPNYHSASEFSWSDSTTIPDGIYYATDKIALSGNNISGNVTLILNNGDGEVAFSGNHHNLTPYINDLLVFAKGKECSAHSVQFSGNGHNWAGIVYSPYGQLQMSGNANITVNGCLWGAQVKLSGNGMTVKNCGDYFGGGSQTISLVE